MRISQEQRAPEAAPPALVLTLPEADSAARSVRRAPTLTGPPSPGAGLARSETRLPSGDPLSTRTWAEEGPWAAHLWGGTPYPVELLSDSDLAR